ncbi:hypothetical protein F5Y09DRAFT_75379 [Xylaria sp. FL1042]|nr:hypothetical protein F5Y09DRAFT_75379 [Xylaria sp. FL1042]
MLRGGATPPSALEAEVGSHHSRTPQTRHSGVYEPPTLTFGPYDEASSNPPTIPTTISIGSNTASAHRQHQRQQSAPSFPARRLNVPSLPPSPGHNKRYSQGMPLTGDGRGGNSPGRLGGWRSGASTPPGERNDASPFSHQAARTPDTTPKSTTQSRFGFLASSVSAFTSRMTSPTQVPAARTDDELCDLDIEAALFPAVSSPLEGSDAFSPAAYKNLQANATGLLHRMQDAYRERTIALRELQAEREAQREEMEEMELRTRNFKSQLERMAAKAAEQEQAMQQLVAELQAERQARRHHEEHVRKLMVKVMATEEAEGADSVIVTAEEDLGVDEKRFWRASNSTVKSDLSMTDTDGFDSAAEESESIFSRSRSPTTCATSTETDSIMDMPSPSVVLLHPKAAAAATTTKMQQKSTPQQQQQLTAFQRLVKGMSAGKEENGGAGGADGCRNCKGRDASVAWDTVSLLRDENIALKQRVAQLDVVIEGALDVVNGIKL